jgi:hypothetical protein
MSTLTQAARMEWIKLLSLRSTWWTLAFTVAGTVGIGVAVGLNSRDASVDLTNNVLAGVVPGVLRAVVLTGTACCLLGLLGLGLGAIVRHSAAAVGVLVGGVYVVVQVIGFTAHGVAPYLPILILANSLSTTGPVSCGPSCPAFLSAWAGLGVLSLYALIALLAGGWLLARRDA